MLNPLDTKTKTGMVVRGAEIISNVGTFILTLKNGVKLSAVKTNTEDIKMLNRQTVSRVADINDTLRYYFPKPQPQPQQPVPAPAQQAPAPVVPVFTQPVVAPQPQPVPVVGAATQVQQPATAAVPLVNSTANTAVVPVQTQVVAPQPAAAPTQEQSAAPVTPAAPVAEPKQG